MTDKFIVPSRRSSSALLRKNSQKLNEIAENNDRVWKEVLNPVADVVVRLRNAIMLQQEIKDKSEIFRKQKEEILEEIIENPDSFKKFISKDEDGKMTLSFKQENLNELSSILGSNVKLIISEYFVSKDEKSLNEILGLLKEFNYEKNDFLTLSQYKISDALNKIKSKQSDKFDKFLELVDKRTEIKLRIEK
ncbi:MAG: hypothetical protein ACP5TL_03040 [Candidatus Micrarchaeia archaeon]